MYSKVLVILLTITLFSCQNTQPTEQEEAYPTTGSIERLSPILDEIIPIDAQIEVLADSFLWSEGPLWLADQEAVIFSDIPNNRIMKWSEADGLELYLQPAGYTGETERGGEMGSNGLLLNEKGQLVLCQHGDRRMAIMNAELDAPTASFTTLADRFDEKRFNSPNDAVFHSNGDLYFTDPPYGLEGQMGDSTKETDFQGVYHLSNGNVNLITDQTTRPNGIGLSPDEKTLYVANSDPENPVWRAYDVQEDGSATNERIFFDATELSAIEKGLPDGLKVAKNGNIFATGPGGVLIFTPEGEHLGTIQTGQATANCAFDTDEGYLYMTAHMFLMRVKLQNN